MQSLIAMAWVLARMTLEFSKGQKVKCPGEIGHKRFLEGVEQTVGNKISRKRLRCAAISGQSLQDAVGGVE